MLYNRSINQAVIAQWLAWRLATIEVPGSNSGKGESLLISEYKPWMVVKKMLSLGGPTLKH